MAEKKKRRSRGAKGSSFEREICKTLSKWWTIGERDDIFWRSTTSGARATSRKKRGRSTFGQYGDVQAMDPTGQPFMDLCTIEMKRGYTETTMQEVLDKPAHKDNKKGLFELWIAQAKRSRVEAGARYWLLITRRNLRGTIVYMPKRFAELFTEYGSPILKYRPNATLSINGGCIFCTTLDVLLTSVSRDMVMRIVEAEGICDKTKAREDSA